MIEIALCEVLLEELAELARPIYTHELSFLIKSRRFSPPDSPGVRDPSIASVTAGLTAVWLGMLAGPQI